MVNTDIQNLVNNVNNLVSLPEIALRVNEMVNDPDSNAENIAKVIAQDPGLSARLLKIANSPFYGLSTEVDSIPRAVTILGTQRIRDLVLSTTATHAFDGIPNELIDMQDFWHHSLYCGLLAQMLAKKSKKVKADSMFIAGLLHDVGQLIMFNQLPEKSHEALLILMEGSEDLDTYQAEQHVFGFDHTQVGFELLKKWHLSPLLQECIAFHHEPAKAKDFPAEASLINIANAVAVVAEFNDTSVDDSDEIPRIDPDSWEKAGISKDDLTGAINEVNEEIAEIEKILFPS